MTRPLPSTAVVSVRPATTADADDVVALVQSAYRSPESRTGWTTEADLVGGQRADAAMVRELVRDPDGVVLLGVRAGHDPEVVACCHVHRRGDHADVGMFAVRPGLQGGGIGRRMLRAAEDRARAWGADALRLSVLNHRDELVVWYERRGFHLTGLDEPFPYGDERFGLPRREDLVLRTMERRLT